MRKILPCIEYLKMLCNIITFDFCFAFFYKKNNLNNFIVILYIMTENSSESVAQDRF